MFEKSAIGIFIVESPLHCGMGQDIGIIDQPLQRERYTNYPKIQGSEIKGVFRQAYKNKDVEEIFGPEASGVEGGDYASAVSFGDAKILFFPVKSLKGVYVWLTCSDVINKFARILRIAGINDIKLPNHFLHDLPSNICVANEDISIDKKVVLEEYSFDLKGENINFSELIDKLLPKDKEYEYLKEKMNKSICVVSDDIFREFTEMSTEVINRVRIDNTTGVVETGGLWTEEYLPVDTVLYFPVFAGKTRGKDNLDADTILKKLKELCNYLRIGGNETVGKGFVRINWI